MNIFNLWRRAGRYAALVALAVFAASAALAAPSTTVVISQVYGGGGNSGATLTHDFIELHNVSNAPVSIDGWSVQYDSATGANKTIASGSITTLTGTIPAGGYFLIQEAKGAGGTQALPTPDATGTIAMSGTNARVFLVSDSTPLTIGADGCATNGGSIVDRVGTGTAICAETAAAPAMSNTKSVSRLDFGCQDTDNNAADFELTDPNPRNSASPVVLCSGPKPPTVTSVTFSPAAVNAGDAFVNVNVSVTPGDAAISSVTADLTPIGGPVALALTNSGLEWTGSFDVPVTATFGAKTITVTATDAGGQKGTGTGTLTINYQGEPLTVAQARAMGPTEVAVPVRGIVVTNTVGNAYMVDPDGNAGIMLYDGSNFDGTNGTENGAERLLVPGDEVVATGSIFVLSGELEVNSGSASLIEIVGTGRPVPATKTITVAQATANDEYEGELITFNSVTVTTTPSASSNFWTFKAEDASGSEIFVYIHKNATTLANTPPGVTTNPIPATAGTPATIDGLQAGNVYKISGMLSEYSGQSPAKQIKPRNAADFTLLKTSLIASATATPSVVERGGTLTIAVKTVPATGSTVTADLSSIGGGTAEALTYNAAAGTYTLSVPIPAAAALGQFNIPILASNPAYNAGEIVPSTVRITVTTPPQVMTIAQARAAEEWAQVTVSGEVTNATGTVGTGQTYFQDATGGIYMFGASSTGFVAQPGDKVTVTGFKRTFNGSIEVDYTSLYHVTNNPRTTGFGAPTIAPKVMTQAEWPSNPAILSQTNSLYVLSATGTTNRTYVVTDGTSTGEIFISSRANVDPAALPVVGQAVNVTGIVDRYASGTRDAWQIKPRQTSDLSVGTAPAVIPTQIAFTTQPVGGEPGETLTTQPVVTVRTATGATATSYSGPVALSIQSGTGTPSAMLTGTTTVNAVNGVATFAGLGIDQAGTGYVLNANVYGFATASSAAFNVGGAAVPGDVDKSGAVTLDDVRAALRIAGGTLSAQDASVSFPNADVNNDGSVTLEDAVAIRRLIP